MKASTLVPPLTWLGRARGTWCSRFWVRTWVQMVGDSLRALGAPREGEGEEEEEGDLKSQSCI